MSNIYLYLVALLLGPTLSTPVTAKEIAQKMSEEERMICISVFALGEVIATMLLTGPVEATNDHSEAMFTLIDPEWKELPLEDYELMLDLCQIIIGSFLRKIRKEQQARIDAAPWN